MIGGRRCGTGRHKCEGEGSVCGGCRWAKDVVVDSNERLRVSQGDGIRDEVNLQF